MPIYEFRCPNGHDFEKLFRKMSDAASELPCPECGAVAPRRVSGGAGLVFKGSGFYLTDYGKDAHRKPAPSASSKDGATGDAKGGDAKPDSAKAKGESAGGDATGGKPAGPATGQGKGSSGASGAGGE